LNATKFDQTSIYFDACNYALTILGEAAPRYFSRLLQLSQVNTKEELESIILSWCPKESRPQAPTPTSSPSGEWAVGAKWGDAVRVQSEGGIMWRLRCSCGTFFKVSTNDTTPEHLRKCATCQLADELSESKREIVAKLDQTSTTVLQWHRAHDKLIWNRVHKALRLRDIDNDAEFARELHALCWVKISGHAGDYQDKGFKPSAWLGRVTDNCLRDYFKVTDNRARLAPMVPLPSEDSREAAAKPTKSEELLPAKAVRPKGASPHDKAKNVKHAGWDKAQKWNG
jgi:DNA-directed RNA polymerase specialized sigma24 family protein